MRNLIQQCLNDIIVSYQKYVLWYYQQDIKKAQITSEADRIYKEAYQNYRKTNIDLLRGLLKEEGRTLELTGEGVILNSEHLKVLRELLREEVDAVFKFPAPMLHLITEYAFDVKSKVPEDMEPLKPPSSVSLPLQKKG